MMEKTEPYWLLVGDEGGAESSEHRGIRNAK